MIIVSNTTPLIGLASIQRFDLLYFTQMFLRAKTIA
jgi:predicted nucleic acid-binding protein